MMETNGPPGDGQTIGKRIEIPLGVDPFGLDIAGIASADRKRVIVISESGRLGAVGDWFEASRKRFVIATILTCTVEFTSKFLHKEKGFSSPEEFLTAWKGAHSEGADPHSKVFVHFFEMQ